MAVIYIPINQVACQETRDRKRMLYKEDGASMRQKAAQTEPMKVHEDDNKRLAAMPVTSIFRKLFSRARAEISVGAHTISCVAF